MAVKTPTFRCKKAVLFALLVSLSMIANSSEPRGWLCVGEIVTGFEFTEGIGWRAKTFDPETFVVSKPSQSNLPFAKGVVFWVVEKMGTVGAMYYCNEESGVFSYCGGVGGSFLFNKAHLKFQEVREIGYVQGFKGERPRIQIGSCAKI